jgi:hypothetical protein
MNEAAAFLTARADVLAAWHAHLTDARRRSPHTVRAYMATAGRLMDALEAYDWPRWPGSNRADCIFWPKDARMGSPISRSRANCRRRAAS